MLNTNDDKNPKEGVLKPLGLAAASAFTYAILYVPLILLFDKTVTTDGLALPALAIYLFIFLINYLFLKKDNEPRWWMITCFALAASVAILVAVIS